MATETTRIRINPGADPNPPAVSLTEAATLIGINRQYLKGYAEAMGIRLVRVGPSKAMSRRDLERLKNRLASGETTASA